MSHLGLEWEGKPEKQIKYCIDHIMSHPEGQKVFSYIDKTMLGYPVKLKIISIISFPVPFQFLNGPKM